VQQQASTLKRQQWVKYTKSLRTENGIDISVFTRDGTFTCWGRSFRRLAGQFYFRAAPSARAKWRPFTLTMEVIKFL
jgi:hypothetical protein